MPDKQVDEDTDLTIKPDERTPRAGHHKAMKVPEEQWEENNQRKDTAQGLLDKEQTLTE